MRYTPELSLPPGLLQRLSSGFSSSGLWAATAFKGATSSCASVPPARYHVANHLSWRRLIEQSGVAMRGVVLTGWQRFGAHLKCLQTNKRSLFLKFDILS